MMKKQKFELNVFHVQKSDPSMIKDSPTVPLAFNVDDTNLFETTDDIRENTENCGLLFIPAQKIAQRFPWDAIYDDGTSTVFCSFSISQLWSKHLGKIESALKRRGNSHFGVVDF